MVNGLMMNKKTLAIALTIAISICLAATACAAQSQQGSQMASANNDLSPLEKELAKVHEEFSRFAHSFVRKLNQNDLTGKNRIQVTRRADGKFRATYTEVDPTSIICQVKKTSTPVVPYLGILKYKKKTWESIGDTAQSAKTGKFVSTSSKATTEYHNYNAKKHRWGR